MTEITPLEDPAGPRTVAGMSVGWWDVTPTLGPRVGSPVSLSVEGEVVTEHDDGSVTVVLRGDGLDGITVRRDRERGVCVQKPDADLRQHER